MLIDEGIGLEGFDFGDSDEVFEDSCIGRESWGGMHGFGYHALGAIGKDVYFYVF